MEDSRNTQPVSSKFTQDEDYLVSSNQVGQIATIKTTQKRQRGLDKNLSNKQLTSPQRQVLEKGLHFAVTTDAIPHSEFVASVEKGLQNVKNVDKVALARSKIVQILKNSKLPPKNITTAEVQALKELRSDPTIKIMNSDKGNATVILDSNTNDKKMLNMLSDPEVYRPILSNSKPISTIQKEVNQILDQFVKDQKITVPVCYQLNVIKVLLRKSTVYQKSSKNRFHLGL